MTQAGIGRNNDIVPRSLDLAALVALPVRLVIGWTYFSAFWRRVALADKLDPHVAGYIGEKFNNFLPNALGIGPIIEHLVTHPEPLRVSMTLFTLLEGLVGACVILGLFTRLMSLGVLGLAFGILIGAGWIGTTCLDEWQIGILGVASGFMLFLAGGGQYSLDRFLMHKDLPFVQRRWFNWLASGRVGIKKPVVLTASMAVLMLALFTNQYFHGGVYGPLHNKSIKPVIEISDAYIIDETLHFQLFRTEGVDVYGSFLIGITVVDDTRKKPIINLNGHQLSQLPERNISNRYVAKVMPGKHSLVVPLGAKARVAIHAGTAHFDASHNYTLVLTDVSGATWTNDLRIVRS